MANFQFSLYLRESGLSESEQSNLERIFESLTPERKVIVIEQWPQYLDKLLEIKHYAEAERKRNIFEAFARIEAILDDAQVRKQEADKQAKIQEMQRRENAEGARKFDELRRMEALKKIGRPIVESQ